MVRRRSGVRFPVSAQDSEQSEREGEAPAALPVERATRAPIIEMKKLFLTIFASMIGISSVVFAATSVSPLDLKLKPDFEKQLECNWSMKKSLRVWVGAIEDIRQEKEVGVLVLKEESVPLTSTRPVAEILKEAIERGLKKFIPDGTKAADRTCSNCGDSDGLIYEEGCLKCKSCGYSKCG